MSNEIFHSKSAFLVEMGHLSLEKVPQEFQTELTQGFWILSTQNEVVESQTQLDSRISKSIVRENLASAPVHSYLWVPDSGVAG